MFLGVFLTLQRSKLKQSRHTVQAGSGSEKSTGRNRYDTIYPNKPTVFCRFVRPSERARACAWTVRTGSLLARFFFSSSSSPSSSSSSSDSRGREKRGTWMEWISSFPAAVAANFHTSLSLAPCSCARMAGRHGEEFSPRFA